MRIRSAYVFIILRLLESSCVLRNCLQSIYFQVRGDRASELETQPFGNNDSYVTAQVKRSVARSLADHLSSLASPILHTAAMMQMLRRRLAVSYPYDIWSKMTNQR
jgi:hypothetical protein